MSDAPETIWAWDYEDVETGITHNTVSAHNPTPILATEYRRADLPPTPEQPMDNPQVQALVEALVKIRDRSPTVTTLMTDGSWREALRDVQRISRLALAQLKEIEQ